MEFLVFENYDEISYEAFKILRDAIKANPRITLGLATGSTPLKLYELLIKAYEKGELDFSQVTTINLDEYEGLSDNHPQSYHHFMMENLFSKININPGNIHVPNGLKDECEKYSKIIKTHPIDIQILGLGENGHIAFNEPSDSFSKTTHKVQLTKSTIHANSRFFTNEEEIPRFAYTMGIGEIMSAKQILLLASGSKKANAVKDTFGLVTPQVPSSILQFHSNVKVLVDKEAAGNK